MKLLNSLALPLFLIFLLSDPCQAFFQSDYMISDLESLNSTEFTKETNSWSYKGASCPECIFSLPSDSSCDSALGANMVFGGPNAIPGGNMDFFQREYSLSGPEWYQIGLSYEIWAFTTAELPYPSYQAAHKIYWPVLQEWSFSGGEWNFIGSCPTDFISSRGSHIRFIYKYQVKFITSTDLPTKSIFFGIRKSRWEAPESLDSVGLRDLKIYNLTSKNSGGYQNFPCWTGYGWTGTSCERCHPMCEACSGPNWNQCTKCRSNDFDYGNGICDKSCIPPFKQVPGTMKCANKCSNSFYWARNDSCIETCEEPLAQRTDNHDALLCTSPCSEATNYVYPDKSCSSTCNLPFKESIEATVKFCVNPCKNSGLFLYPDGSCVKTCQAPLSQKTDKNVTFCESPCPSTAKFLHSDMSCSPTCDLPLIEKTENGILSCSSPCDSTEYLYPDGTCQKICPTLFSQKTENGILFCENPCSGEAKYINPDKSCSATCDPLLVMKSEDGILSCSSPCDSSTEYIYPDGSCSEKCPSYLSQTMEKNVKYCETPCSSIEEFVYLNGNCLSTCDSRLKSNTEHGILSCSSPCNPSEYLYPDGSCLDQCPTLFSKKTENEIQFCENPCSGAAKYVNPDQSCSSACDSLLIEDMEYGISSCLSPCDSTEYLYPDGSCGQTCPTFLDQRLKKNVTYCESPCSGAAKYVNPDKSCSSTCDSRLKRNTEHGISTCNNPCSGSTEYVYLDGSCGETCPTPFSQKTENSIKFCENPCLHNDTFLSEDGNCQDACPFPKIAKDDPSIGRTCKFPCANVSYYYNNRNGTCTKTCEYTSKAIESPLPKVCFSTLTKGEVKQVEMIADAANNANSASRIGVIIWSFISSSDSTLACLKGIAKMIEFTKFMDIKFPEKVLILMDAQKSKDSGEFSKGMMKKFPSHELPRKFEVYQSSSSFFVNIWPVLFNLSVLLLITGLVVVGEAKTKRYVKLNGILKSLTEALKWNVLLITFCGGFGDIVLYTALEVQTVQIDSFAAVLSSLVCLGINSLAGFVAFKIIDVNSAIRRTRNPQEWTSYKALFECYKDDSFSQQIFLLVFLVRLVLVNAAIGYLYNYPLIQATIAVFSNILMLGYLVIKRPMKKMMSLIQQIVLELVLLPFNICVLALVIMNSHEIVNTNLHKSIGEVMVYVNVLIPILSLALLATKAILMGVEFYKTWKLAEKNKIEGVQNDFVPIEEESSVASPTKSSDHHVQTVDDQSQGSTGQYSSQSNLLKGNQKIGSIFAANNEYNQNSIPMNIMQEESSSQNYNGGKINKKSKGRGLVQNQVLNGGLGSIEEPDL